MKFSTPARREPTESIVPMINVVFLLLIFFLMTAQIAPPEPFEVTPPDSQSETESDGAFTMYLAGEDQLGYQDAIGLEAVLEALNADHLALCGGDGCAEEDRPTLLLRADAAVPAKAVAALLPKLGGIGFAQVHLVTAAP